MIYSIAIVGATGLVGEKMTALADGLPNVRLRLFANSSAGKKIRLKNRTATVEPCENLLSAKIDYALFMAPDEVAAEFVPPLIKRGVVCIDNSSHFRLRKDVPLVVPCINGETAKGHNLIANPNCSTIQTVIVINALKSLCPTKMVAVTYQSVSGAGAEALSDLNEKHCYGKLAAFRHPIYDNLIPAIGQIRPDGFTSEERKLSDESRKILDLPKLAVNAFCARIPISVCHGVFVNLHLRERVNLEHIADLLKSAPNIILLNDAECGLYPMPILFRNTGYVGVGRLVKDSTANAINFFCVADNLLRGAAYNAYEILLYKIKERETCL